MAVQTQVALQVRSVQPRNQADPRLVKLIDDLRNLGRDYLTKHPIATRFSFFPHTNQPIASCLVGLNEALYHNAGDLMGKLNNILNNFSAAGALLRGIYGLVSDSNIYPDVATQTAKIENQKAYEQRYDDGGGYSPKWQLSDYKQAFKPVLADSPQVYIELAPVARGFS